MVQKTTFETYSLLIGSLSLLPSFIDETCNCADETYLKGNSVLKERFAFMMLLFRVTWRLHWDLSALLCLHICICLQHAINQDSAYKQFTSTFALQFPQQLTLCHRVLWKRMDNDARKVKNNNSVGVVLENDLFSSQVTLFCTTIDVNYSVWRAF